MDVIAHRGFADLGAENTLPRLAAADGRADAVEFDVRLAADGVPVIFHDRRVDRLSPTSGPVDAFDADELGALRIAGSDATVPTLAEALGALSGPIVVDLKVSRLADDLLAPLSAYGGRMLVSSADPALLEALPVRFATAVLLVPPGPRWDEEVPQTAPRSFSDAISVAKAVGAAAIHAPASLCEAGGIRRAQSVVSAVNAWTIQDENTATSMRAAGVDGLITDSPEYV